MLPRTQHAAAQGGDGRIYITGGLEAYANVSSNGSVAFEFYSAPMTDTLVYDINTGWDIKNTTGDIPSERMFHTMVTCKLNSCKRFSYLVEKKKRKKALIQIMCNHTNMHPFFKQLQMASRSFCMVVLTVSEIDLIW